MQYNLTFPSFIKAVTQFLHKKSVKDQDPEPWFYHSYFLVAFSAMVMNDQSLQSLHLARQELSTLGEESDKQFSIKDNQISNISREQRSLVFT